MAQGRDLAINLVVRSKRAAKQLNSFETRTQRLGRALKVGLAAGAVAGGIALARFGGQAVSAASDADEAMNKVQQVFGDAAGSVKKFADSSVTDLALSEGAALEAAGSFGNLFTSFGVGQRDAAGMSTKLVQLAADLASFNNTSVDDAIRALSSGISGEMEALKRYGITLSDVRLRAEATAMGLEVTKGALDPLTKSMAAYSLIMKDSTNAQGDLARTSDGLANTQKILGAAVDDAKETIGVGLVKALEAAAQAAGGPEGLAGQVDYTATRIGKWIEGIGYLIPELQGGEQATREYEKELERLGRKLIDNEGNVKGFLGALVALGAEDTTISYAEALAEANRLVAEDTKRAEAAARAMIRVMGGSVKGADHLTRSIDAQRRAVERVGGAWTAAAARAAAYNAVSDKETYFDLAAELNRLAKEARNADTGISNYGGSVSRAETKMSKAEKAAEGLKDRLGELNTQLADARSDVQSAVQAYDSFASSVNSALGSEVSLASAFSGEQARKEIEESGKVTAQTWLAAFQAQLGSAESAGEALTELEGALRQPNGQLVAGAEALFQQILTVPPHLIPQVVTELIDSGLAPNLAGSLNHIFEGPVGAAWAETFRGEGLTAAEDLLGGLESKAAELTDDFTGLGKKIGADIRAGIQDEIRGVLEELAELESRVTSARGKGLGARPRSGRDLRARNAPHAGGDRVAEARVLAQVLRDAEAALGAKP